MVSFFLRWTLLKFFSLIPDEQSQQKVRQSGRITGAVINTSNEVKCPLLWEFWIYNFSRRILERVFVGRIVNIRNECLFFWVHGEWIVARNKQIDREPLRGSRDLFVPRLRFIPHEPRKKDTHSLSGYGIKKSYDSQDIDNGMVKRWYHRKETLLMITLSLWKIVQVRCPRLVKFGPGR